ncbi:MAG: PASTA domain-containing protein [Ruminococcaceae bacterium]|nr:PASTA domain-containing protein [Oscillospiraceae bacterium]
MDNYIGKMLDHRYEILEMIGSGGMAVVYKALCHRLNRPVAIKILKHDFGQDAELHRRFQVESQAVAMLSHPNIVSVYDVSSSDDTDYIVMELIDGITLKQYMQKKGVLSWREALHFTMQIASALSHAHSRGIVHRDIKPHNVMVLKDGSIKVADFGIARVLSAQNTLTRETLGSVHYISPEQAKGGRVDQRTDLYSLGVVLYEMLTGKLPYEGDSAVSVAIQHISGNLKRPTELNPEIPIGLEQIVLRAMSGDLDARYASADQMLADLEAFRQDQKVSFGYRLVNPAAKTEETAPIPKTEEEVPAKNSHTTTIMIAIFMLLAFVGIGYFLYSYILKDLFTSSAELTVPDLSGAYYTSLTDEKYADFNIVIEKWTDSDTVEYGYVIRQDPAKGKKVKQGATIEVTVSQGQMQNIMPQVVNMNQSAAEKLLRDMQLGLKVQIEQKYSDVYVSNQIIDSEPKYGEPLEYGDTVTLIVSMGVEVELVEVPDLVGRPIDDALRMIEEAGLVRGAVTYETSEADRNCVIYQSTESGVLVKKTTMINLRVSLGMDSVQNDTPSAGGKPGSGDEKPQEPDNNTQQPGQDPEVPDALPLFDQGNPNPEEYKRQTIDVTMPVGVGTVSVTLQCNGKSYGNAFVVDLENRTIQIAVYGTGSMEFDVFVNGARIYFTTVDFEAGQQ